MRQNYKKIIAFILTIITASPPGMFLSRITYYHFARNDRAVVERTEQCRKGPSSGNHVLANSVRTECTNLSMD